MRSILPKHRGRIGGRMALTGSGVATSIITLTGFGASMPAAEFRQFVKKKYPIMSERYLAWFWY